MFLIKNNQMLKNKHKELLYSVSIHDCETQTFRAGGKGGQKQNKTESGVRVIHHPSGAIGESREERSQYQNKKIAFRRMAETKKFKIWTKIECTKRIGLPSVEELVRQTFIPSNLKVEVLKNKKWIEDKDFLPTKEEMDLALYDQKEINR